MSRSALVHTLGAIATLATPVLPLPTAVTIVAAVAAAVGGANLAAWCLTLSGARADKAITLGAATCLGLFFAAGAAGWPVIAAATGAILGTPAVIAARQLVASTRAEAP